MTTDARFAVLSALIDREPVDPDALSVALEDSAGRAELVDFVRLRARMAETLDEPVAPIGREPASHVPASHVKVWIARAALLLLPLLFGAAAGAWFMQRREPRPPTPTRIVQFVAGVDWK